MVISNTLTQLPDLMFSPFGAELVKEFRIFYFRYMPLFKFGVDGIRGQNKIGKGIKLSVDNFGIDTNKKGASLAVDGLGTDFTGKGGLGLGVDGITFDTSSNFRKVGIGVEGLRTSYVFQKSIDSIFEKALNKKLNQLLGIKETRQHNYLKRLWNVFKEWRKGNIKTIKDAKDVFFGSQYSHSRQDKNARTFSDFISRFFNAGRNPNQYLFDNLSMEEKLKIKQDLMDDFSGFNKDEKRALLGIYDKTLKVKLGIDNVGVELNLSRRVRSAETLHNALARFNQMQKDRFLELSAVLSDKFRESREITDIEERNVFLRGAIKQFKDKMRGELRRSVLGGYMFGAGGLQRLSAGHLRSMSATLTDQFRYLDGYVADLYAIQEQGSQIDANSSVRAGRYANAVNYAFYQSYNQKAIDTYGSSAYEKRILSPDENCDDCLEYAEMGCQVIGTLPLPTIGSRCRQNCKCQYMVYESLEQCGQDQESFATDGEET